MIEAYSVSRLARIIKELLETDLRLSNIWVEGEISNLSRSQAGHTYFTLKDENAQFRCVMFRRAYAAAPPSASSGQALEAGAQVLAHGYVSFYEARGDLQFYVDFVQPAGVGVWQAQLERLKAQLEAEGLFEAARKRPLPPFPRRIGVVTSPAGAVFHDICHIIGRRWPLAEVVLAPTPVQGPEAVPGILEALRALNEEPGIDLIILARGGGSIEELWAFNSEEVARAIAGSRIPVVSAVGHETDFTVADLVADVRAPTPSGAAELVFPDRRALERQVAELAHRLRVALRQQLVRDRARLERLRSRPVLARPLEVVHRRRQVVDGLGHRLALGGRHALTRGRAILDRLAARLEALSPLAVLGRGYGLCLDEAGRPVASVAGAAPGDRVRVVLRDGSLRTVVEAVEAENNKGVAG